MRWVALVLMVGCGGQTVAVTSADAGSDAAEACQARAPLGCVVKDVTQLDGAFGWCCEEGNRLLCCPE